MGQAPDPLAVLRLSVEILEVQGFVPAGQHVQRQIGAFRDAGKVTHLERNNNGSASSRYLRNQYTHTLETACRSILILRGA